MADEHAPMLLGWVIVYVDDPPAAREFYMRAFGLHGGFVAGSRTMPSSIPARRSSPSPPTRSARRTSPAACDPRRRATAHRRTSRSRSSPRTSTARYARALAAGCPSLAAPKDKPQGQRVAYVRDPFGSLLELATPL